MKKNRKKKTQKNILKPRNPFVPASTVRNGAGKHRNKKKDSKSNFVE